MKLSDERIAELIFLNGVMPNRKSLHNSDALKELQIRRKLQEYVGHKIGCDGFKCTCGLAELLKELEGV